jgi:hypothetical protein
MKRDAQQTTHTHFHSLHPRYWHSPQSSLAGTWELHSLSHRACIPLYRHRRCKKHIASRSLLDVWPRGRNQDKPLHLSVFLNHHRVIG